MMQTIAIIACGNGFGHVRRCVLIGEALIIRGVRVTLFAPTRALEKINRSVGVKDRFTTVDFDSSTSAEALRTGNPNSARWEHRLPPLDRFDLVLCDNLPEVLAVRPDAILSGNFLWHQALPDIAKEIRTRADSLLAAHRPTMITYGPFAAKELQNVTRCLPVALSQDRRDVTNAERRALLISCGHGLASRDETMCLIETVAEGPRPEVDMVFRGTRFASG